MSAMRTIVTGLVGNHVRSRAKGKGIGKAVVGMVVARVAMGSLPGAMLVGGGLVAKAIYDRRKTKANEKGEVVDTAPENAKRAKVVKPQPSPDAVPV